MIHFTHLHIGNGFGILYRFDKRGSGIPMHAHDAETEHEVWCTSGRVAIYGPQPGWRVEMKAGEHAVFDSTQPHEICALEDYSSVLNSFKNGQPESYKAIAPCDCDGSRDDLALQHPLEGGTT